MKRIFRAALAAGLALVLALSCCVPGLAVTKEEIDAMKARQQELQSQMDGIQSQLSQLEQKQNSAVEQSLLYQQQMGLLTQQIAETQNIIADYETQIADTQAQLEEAKQQEADYYALFCTRVRDMEERNTVSYWSILFDATSFSDLLDRMTLIRDIARYDDTVIDQLAQARQTVADTETRLEEEKAGHEAALADLEQQQADIQAASDKNDALLAEIRANQAAYQDQLDEMEDMSDELAADIVTSEAAYADQLEALRRQAEEDQRRQEEERRRQEAENTGGSDADTGNDTPAAPEIPGGGTGSQVAAYACQFIGNPYVWGGNSLTNGIDCSGFVREVYRAFGYNLPRSSWSLRNCGVGVSYEEAQPGDIIFYQSAASASGGHVGLYIGGGQMVSALGKAYGICITNVNTGRTGFTVRRVIQ